MSVSDDENLANKYFYPKYGVFSNVNIVPQREIKRKVLQSAQNGHGLYENISNLEKAVVKKEMRAKDEGESQNVETKGDNIDEKCFVSSAFRKRNFTALDQTVYLYSAYLDERFGERIIRVMSILALDKKERSLELFCHFKVNETHVIKKAKMYELCENHGKRYGGFIWSCEVPSPLIDVCHVNVSLNIVPVNKKLPSSELSPVTIAVTKLKAKQIQYNYSICVPPLFGNIDSYKFVEFIELNRMFGVEHFIFYNYNINNKEVLKLLDHYSNHELVTLIDWGLPSTIQKNQIWYNGQLSAHNDCLYRAMSLTKYLSIIDIDEYIVPHNNKRTFSESFGDLFTSKVCGLSFDSAFYDPKFSNKSGKSKSGLVTTNLLSRTRLFSKVRTKVMVQPTRIFEVGIHHISKPAAEDFKVLKVNTSTAYLHHYRTCVPNYGMKCGDFDIDETLLPFEDELQAAVTKAQSNIINNES